MNTAILILSALSAGVSAAVAVLVASPGVALPPAAVVGMTAIAAGLAAMTAMLARGQTPTG